MRIHEQNLVLKNKYGEEIYIPFRLIKLVGKYHNESVEKRLSTKRDLWTFHLKVDIHFLVATGLCFGDDGVLIPRPIENKKTCKDVWKTLRDYAANTN